MLRKFPFALLLACIMYHISISIYAQYRDVKRFRKSYRVPADKLFKVNIDIDAGEVQLNVSPRKFEARVTIIYTEDEFDIYSDFDEKKSRLDVEFEKKGWVNRDDDHVKAEAIIELPSKVEIDLNAKIKAGEVDIDLGGLALVGFDLTTWAGEVLVDFSKPNQTEMDYLNINTKIGETEIVRVGNARFKEADINGGIGEMTIDFRGEFVEEAEANVDLDIGETRLYLPENVGIKLAVSKFLFMSDIDIPRRFRKSGKYYYSHNYKDSKNVLVLRVSPGLGGLRIDY